MQLIYIHVAPAVGKLTVAREVTKLVPARLFDNHASIDLALTVFDHSTPEFWDLVASARVLVLGASAKENIPLVIMTSCYSEPHDRLIFEKYMAVLEKYSASMCPVFLHCSDAEMERRVSDPDRKARGKISSQPGLERFLEQYNPVPVPYANCLKIATDKISETDAAVKIVEYFGLDQV